jgi:hypothetical protein
MLRLGHKGRHRGHRFLKHFAEAGDSLAKLGGGMATAGAISSATGVGASVGVPMGIAGGVFGAVGSIAGGGARLIGAGAEGDLEGGVDATGQIIGGTLGLRK